MEPTVGLCQAIRAARAAPALGLATVARAAAVAEGTLIDGLCALRWRGRCDTLVADTLRSGNAAGRVAAAASRTCPPPLRRLAARDFTAEVRPAGAGTPAWSGRCVATRGRPLPRSVIAVSVAASAAGCPPAMLAAAAQADRAETRDAAAVNPNCPPQMLAALIDDSDWQTSRRAAANPACPPQILAAAVLHHPGSGVREIAAHNSSCGPAAIVAAARSSDWVMRAAAAQNPNCGPRERAALACDDAPAVVCAVARNPNCDAATLRSLARSDDLHVHRDVLKKTRTARDGCSKQPPLTATQSTRRTVR